MRNHGKRLLRWRPFRFVIVGISNAAINFLILNFAYYHAHVGKLGASILATSSAMLFSFFMNRHYVFEAKQHRLMRQAIPFIIVTVFSSFIILNAVYFLSIHALAPYESWISNTIYSIIHLRFSESFISINGSTVIGAIAAMICNYNGYRYFVFKHQQEPELEEETAGS